MKRGYPYIRFSTTEQRKGDSLRRQLAAARRWCEANDAVLDDSLDFLNELGHSGFDGSNLEEGGGLGLFLAAIKAGQVAPGAVLLVEKLDRFSRTDVDIAVAFFGKVLRTGVNIVSMNSGVEYSAEMLRRQPTAIVTAVLEFILANEESVKKSERLSSAHAAKREKARQGIPQSKRGPLWLRLTGTDGTNRRGNNGEKWEVIEERAKVVRRIFTLTAEGVGGYDLAARLNAEGVPPFERRPHWSQKAVHRILVNRAAVGMFQPQKKVDGKPVNDGPEVADYFPAVVDLALFHKANATMNGKAVGGRKAGGRTGRLFIFQKLVRDAVTGSTLVVKSSKGAGGYIRYLIPSASLRGQAAVRATVPADAFELALLGGLAELKAKDLAPGETRAAQRLADVAGQMAELDHRIRETTEAMKNQPPSLMGAIVRQVAEWEKEKADLARQHEELKARGTDSAVSTLGEMKSVATMLAECKGEECDRLRARIRAVLRRLIDSVHCVWVKRGRYDYLGAVQVFFRSGESRGYHILIRSPSGNGTVRVPGFWCVRTWTDESLRKAMVPAQFDLRHAGETLLGAVDDPQDPDHGREVWVPGWEAAEESLTAFSAEDLDELVFGGCERHELP